MAKTRSSGPQSVTRIKPSAAGIGSKMRVRIKFLSMKPEASIDWKFSVKTFTKFQL
jgi:hypothetical protein